MPQATPAASGRSDGSTTTSTTATSTADAWATSRTENRARRRASRPPLKSAPPQRSEERRASAAAATDPEPRGRPWTHVGLTWGADPATLVESPARMTGSNRRTEGRMLKTQERGRAALRFTADRIEAHEGRSHYRRRRLADRPAAAEDVVTAAVARAREGDDDALRLLYLLFADHVYGLVLGVVRSPHDAEDVTSEVFARLPRALGRY